MEFKIIKDAGKKEAFVEITMELTHGKCSLTLPWVILDYEVVKIKDWIDLVEKKQIDDSEYQRIYGEK